MTTLLAHAMRDAAAAPRRRPPTTGPVGRPRPRRHRRTFAENTWRGQQEILAHAYRPAADADVRPDLADVALPADRRPVTDPDEAVTVLQEHPVNAQLRVDSYDTRMAVCAALGRCVAEDGMALVSHAVIAERASGYAGRRIARATAGDHLRALEDVGALIVAFRGRSAAVAGRNLASVYVVTAAADTLPPRHMAAVADLAARLEADTTTSPPDQEAAIEDTPGVSLVEELRQHPFRDAFDLQERTTPDRTTGHFPCSEPRSTPASMPGGTSSQHPRTLLRDVSRATPTSPQRTEHPERFTARTDGERRAAAAWLIHRLGWAYSSTEEAEAVAVCRDFFAADWTALALLRAFFYWPDGEPFKGPLEEPHNRDRANPVRVDRRWGLITWRLKQWRHLPPAGRRFGPPLPPPIPAETPRRGRPPGAVTQRRRAAERVERMGMNDPRRAVELAALRGEQVTVSWRPRSPEAAAAVAALRKRLPDRFRQAERVGQLDQPAVSYVEPSEER